MPFWAWPGGQKSSPRALLVLPAAPLLPPAVSGEEAGGDAAESPAAVGPETEAPAAPAAVASDAPEEVLPPAPDAPALSLFMPDGEVPSEVLPDEDAGETFASDEAPLLPEVTEPLEEPVMPPLPLTPLEGSAEEGAEFVAVP